MKPNDESGKLPASERPFRVLIISGSDRRQYNCPGVDSKSRTLMLRMAERLPQEWEIDYEDLGNVFAREHIQSCNACVSTSMALCVWPCNCYEKRNRWEPDLMWNLDLYSRLDLADAWAIIGPINWYAPTSNLKLMFDRLVCMNGGNPREDLIEHKDAELAKKLEHSPQWKELSLNHLEGRTAGFFCYGDGGADELDTDDRPKLLRHKQYFNPNQATVFADFDHSCEEFAGFVGAKGKVEPGRYRAYGYEAPGHFNADLKAKWREIRTGLGIPPRGSSPAQQQKLDLNKDATLRPKKSEGEKLRE